MTHAKALSFTPQQELVIASRGNVLVSAGAGTGKTRTLVERCLQLLRQGHSLDRMLLVTFTEAAAGEMRSRIRQQLQGQKETWAEEQLALLERSSISTLHAFCLQLVRENFYRLQLDPHLQVLDESIAIPLLEEVLDTEFAQLLEEKTEEQKLLTRLIRHVGGEEAFRRLVKRLHRYAQTLPSPDAWFESQTAHFSQEEPTQWLAHFLPELKRWFHEWDGPLQNLAENPNVQRCLPHWNALQTALAKKEAWDEIFELLRCVRQVQEVDWVKHGTNKDTKKFFQEVDFLASLLAPAENHPGLSGVQEDWQWMRPQMKALLQAARQLGLRFAQAKREQGGIDFSDLEQLTLRLLHDPDGKSSELAQGLQERFDFIFVDEYQDINAAQDAIITAISRPGEKANRFLVGDIKQSIYRFRLANPRIFSQYQAAWQNGPAQCLFLSENFRSHENLLQFANDFFGEWMRESLGGTDYGPTSALQFGNRAGRSALASCPEEARVEFHLISKTGEEGIELEESSETQEPSGTAYEDLHSAEKEAHVIAQRLLELKETGSPIWQDGVGFRPVDWGDMVILVRSLSGSLESYAKVFHQLNIPFAAPRPGFFDAFEIRDLLNLLRLLDNPMQDIPLLGVLRSPLAGFSDNELALIRSTNPERSFWELLRQFVSTERAPHPKEAPGLREKTRQFLASFTHWRNLVQQTSVSRCLEIVLAETRYETLLAAHPRGQEMLGNVSRLLRLAHEYDPYQRQGLYRFLRYVDLQEELNLALEAAASPPLNAVRLSTIHRSKGLEYPVVVLAGLGHRFNFQDLHGEILLDEGIGLCPRVHTPDGQRRYSSLAHWVANRRGKRELRSEEMRLLYVALTRPKDRLILTGVTSEKKLQQLLDTAEEEAKPPQADQANCFMDWFHAWLQSRTSWQWQNESQAKAPGLSLKIHRSLPPGAESKITGTISTMTGVQWETHVAQINQPYPWSLSTREPAKTSLSAVKNRLEDEESGPFPFIQPAVHSTKTGSALTRGNAHHKFLQNMALEPAFTGNRESLEAAAQLLFKKNLFTPEEQASLDLESLAQFWQSPLGRKIMGQVSSIHRELPFTARMSGQDWAEVLGGKFQELPWLKSMMQLSDEFVVVQGVVDLAVLLPDQIWLLDFKTDNISPKDANQKAEGHRPQLDLYALALSRIYQKPVTEKWLHFLTPNVSIQL